MKKVLSRYVSEVREYVPSDNIYLSGVEVIDFQTTNELIISAIEDCLKTLKSEKIDGGLLKCAIVHNPALQCAKIVFEFEQQKMRKTENNA